MKKTIKNILKRLDIFYEVKFSPFTQWYLEQRNPSLKKQRAFDRQFFSELLGTNNQLIFDIGANQGHKTHIFRKLSKKVVSVDPDDTNFAILNIRFKKNPDITIIKKAVDASNGESVLYITEEGSGLNTMSNKWKDALSNTEESRWEHAIEYNKKVTVNTITMGDLIRAFGTPDFIKVDVEGFEKNVISGIDTPVPLISFECNLPEFYSESLWCVDHLHSLDNSYLFNAFDEKTWVFNDFITYDQFRNWFVNENQKRYFEIFAKRSK
ncbi:FkbM family methyltransferase [Pseudoflavitalea sp. G-6-1-2]|uniref:FkbM family methyltransferase n=1 Tax=Pseudoflavitalea sp. G-6-1-2 TaxID=2728841 RepID=UPI00146A2239|nr:FkbM family methyltransferase [Pseudoflavitalea sp. G-6-1-2]NML19602.1 FkbM family methyltransferase [Pseudoflavitalea sp. G-6-1-2]